MGLLLFGFRRQESDSNIVLLAVRSFPDDEEVFQLSGAYLEGNVWSLHHLPPKADLFLRGNF